MKPLSSFFSLYLMFVALFFVHPVQAEQVSLAEGVTIQFPEKPEFVDEGDFARFDLLHPSDDGAAKVVFLAGKFNVPFWLEYILNKVPDALPEMLAEQVPKRLEEQFPGAKLTKIDYFELNGLTGVEFQLDEIVLTKQDLLSEQKVDRVTGRMLFIKDKLYIALVAEQQSHPAAANAVADFLHSLQTQFSHQPGDAGEQLLNLGLIILGFALLALILLITGIVLLVVFLRRRKKTS